MFKTLCFHCRGHGFDSWSGKFHVSHSTAKKEKQKKNEAIALNLQSGYYNGILHVVVVQSLIHV